MMNEHDEHDEHMQHDDVINQNNDINTKCF